MIDIVVVLGDIKYTFVILKSDTSKALNELDYRYYLTTLMKKFNLLSKRQIIDKHVNFRNALIFHKFIAKMIKEEITITIKNDGFKSKNIDEIVEHFKYFWD